MPVELGDAVEPPVAPPPAELLLPEELHAAMTDPARTAAKTMAACLGRVLEPLIRFMLIPRCSTRMGLRLQAMALRQRPLRSVTGWTQPARHPAETGDDHADKQQAADHDLLDVGVDVHLRQCHLKGTHDGHGEHDSGYRAAAAEDRDTAQEHDRYDVELETEASGVAD